MIETLAQLRTLYAEPAERALRKQRPALDAHCQRFVALSPFCVVASAGAGTAHSGPGGALLDASPRGGAPGFAKTPDAHTLLLPDSGGNNRLDTLENLLADPRIGLLFLIPGVNEVLRVNGRASLRDEAALVQRFAQPEARALPKLVIEVAVREAYLHCPKALMRSSAWAADGRLAQGSFPSMNSMLRTQLGADLVPETEAQAQARYAEQLASEGLTIPSPQD